ncbi:MAG: WD40/YVTN/BNR-like repeat-containing protein, partial [Stackebrandtia sp.]
VALSIGEAEASKVYVTSDGGASWHNSFTNTEPTAFYDCMAFFDEQHGVAMSDPVDGRIRFITTDDGGHSWQILPPEQSPKALDGEFAFAASGQCLVTADEDNGYLVTGGGPTARVIHTPDRGQSWEAHDTPIASGESAGIYAASFRDPEHAILVGGDFNKPEEGIDAAAYTRKGPDGFTLSPKAPGEYRSSVDHLVGSIAVTVGPTGSDLSLNGGRDWHRFDDGVFDSVQCAKLACWASGPDGRIATLDLG